MVGLAWRISCGSRVFQSVLRLEFRIASRRRSRNPSLAATPGLGSSGSDRPSLLIRERDVGAPRTTAATGSCRPSSCLRTAATSSNNRVGLVLRRDACLSTTAVDRMKKGVRNPGAGSGLLGAILVSSTQCGPRQHVPDGVCASPLQPARQPTYLLYAKRHRTFRCFLPRALRAASTACASRDRVMWRYQPCHRRTS